MLVLELDDRQTASNAADALDISRQEALLARDVLCVMGVPIDVIDLEGAVNLVRQRALEGQRCFVSTPNLNFAATASSDDEFRNSLKRSDLCLVDGMPLVWIARLLRLPIRERVSGADLFSRLSSHSAPAIKVFFFGGPPGIAEQACERLNGGSFPGVRCVGFATGGFGSIDELSSAALIRQINDSHADFVVVALGAQKGQAWIVRNLAVLNAPVISHLGAVVNFVAGSVRRAPRLVQGLGLEWLWRIKEQPDLWRRYARDGAVFAHWALSRVIPLAALSWWRAAFAATQTAPVLDVSLEAGTTTLKLSGAWTHGCLGPLRGAMIEAAKRRHNLSVDLRGVTWVDSAFVGSMLIAEAVFDQAGGFELRGPHERICRIFRALGAGRLLQVQAESNRSEANKPSIETRGGL